MGGSNEFINNDNELVDAVRSLGALFGIGGVNVEVKPGEGTTCNLTKKGLTIQVDPDQIARSDSGEKSDKQILSEDALYIAGEVIGYVRDLIDGGMPEAKNEKDKFFWMTVQDAAIDTRLKSIPLLDSITEDVYKTHRFPESQMSEAPKHVQFMEAVLLKSIVPNGDWRFDQDIEQLIEQLRNYHIAGETVDILEHMNHRETSIKNRIRIANQFLRPVYDALYDEDVQNGMADDNSESEDGDGASDNGSRDGQEGDGESEGDAFSGGYNRYEEAMHGSANRDKSKKQQKGGTYNGMSMHEIMALMQQMGAGGYFPDFEMDEEDEYEDDDMDDGNDEKEYNDFDDDNSGQSNLAGRLQQELKLNKADTLAYLEVLTKYRGVISQTADVLLKLSNLANTTNAPTYRSIADEHGRRLHPSRLMQFDIQRETGQQQSFWQPMENKNTRSEYLFGGLDITLCVDVSQSMSGIKGMQAGALAIIMLEAKELAARRAEMYQQQFDSNDVRTRVIAFGSGAKELSPMQNFASSRDKGRIFHNLVHPSSSATNISKSLEMVRDKAVNNTERDQIVFLITDAQFSDKVKAKEIVKSMPDNVLLAQFEINPSANQNVKPDGITPYTRLIKSPEQTPSACLRLIYDYVDAYDNY